MPTSNEKYLGKNLGIIKGIGPKSIEKLARLGIKTIQDLLLHLPIRYQDRTKKTLIKDLRPGSFAVVDAVIDYSQIKFGRRRSLFVEVYDDTGSIGLRFFYFTTAQKKNFLSGKKIRCFGEVRNGPNSFELIHPEYFFIGKEDSRQFDSTLTPIYPSTEGISQRSWRDYINKAIQLLDKEVIFQELLPSNILDENGLPSLKEAICFLHKPPTTVSYELLFNFQHPAQQRLIFEELLTYHICLKDLRKKNKKKLAPNISKGSRQLASELKKKLPFTLTNAQKNTFEEAFSDLSSGYPMMRLIQGDVGCGKTIIAALISACVVEANYQVALMAPTELLAEQHQRNFSEWFSYLKIKVGFLCGKHKGKEREKILRDLANGEISVLIGTHALFQKDVIFQSLGLVIVDEQHRFGVNQRLRLREKGKKSIPHQLTMTATPIPRTLAMTAYADHDLSIIDELPPGRKPVVTSVISQEKRNEIVERVGENCERGQQAYWVCNLIEESEFLQAQAAEDIFSELEKSLTSLKIGLLHGKQKSIEKEKIMQEFNNGEINLLVSTTVIEVGVDVPNANVMIIENAERLGLAQLHQLRGRVGRGLKESHCVLMYRSPLSQVAKERLSILRETNDGFLVSKKDLELRGPGEVLGIRQTGELNFKIADMSRDYLMLDRVQNAANKLINEDTNIVNEFTHRWIGEKTIYYDV